MKKLFISIALLLVLIIVKNFGYISVFRYANAINEEKPFGWKMRVSLNTEIKRCIVTFPTDDFYLSKDEKDKDAYMRFDRCVRAARMFLEKHPNYFLNEGYSLEIRMHSRNQRYLTYISNGRHLEFDEFYDFAPDGTENLSCMRIETGKLSYLENCEYLEALKINCEIDDFTVFRKLKNLRYLNVAWITDPETKKNRRITKEELKMIQEYLPECEIEY